MQFLGADVLNKRFLRWICHAKALRLTFPIMMGYIPLGSAFAVTWVQQGLPWWAAIAAALLLVHAGGIDSKQTLALAIAVLLVLLFVTPRRFLLAQGGNV